MKEWEITIRINTHAENAEEAEQNAWQYLCECDKHDVDFDTIQAKYTIQKEGCPKCGSTNIFTEDEYYDRNTITRQWCCAKCSAQWYEDWVFQEWEMIEEDV